MPSDVQQSGTGWSGPPRYRGVKFSRRTLRSLLVLFGLVAAAWTIVSGLHSSRPPSRWPISRPTKSAGTPLSEVASWPQLGLEETASGLVVLPALEPGDVLERHPVELLIEAAEAKARRQVADRPKTLDQAVAQYRRLFAAEPPLGFDKWFSAFDPPPAILPKAREQIVPFLSIPGRMLRERLKRLDGVIQTVSFDFRGGEIFSIDGQAVQHWRAHDLAQLLNPLAPLIPDMKVYYNVDDAPRQLANHHVWNATGHFGARNQLWPEEERAAFEDNQQGVFGYRWACGPDSPAGRAVRGAELASDARHSATGKAFVLDHAKAMDYCLAPDLLQQHSLLLAGRPEPDLLTPMFSYCRSVHSMDLSGVPTGRVRLESPFVPWAQKTEPKLYWRGRGTGAFTSKDIPWRATQRFRLHRFSHPTWQEAEIPVAVLTPTDGGSGWRTTSRSRGSLVEEMLDVALTGGPILCEQVDGTCDEIAAEITYAPRSAPGEAARFRYVLDVDGNGWSNRFRRLLHTGSVVFKATIFPEWYSDALIPFHHYVPVQNSYADLFDLVAFFEARPALAQVIGENGRRFALEEWSWESMQAYHLLALLEYARALAEDREAATYHHS